ncbi:MAG: serine hydrolase [Prolixibacteraceae bacterium]|nr:serine hydrolase [Prolixibacteraceae bacterium]
MAKQGKIIYSEGLGEASRDLNVPVTLKTRFRTGEVSELFTSLIYQLMVEKGILNPDSTVQHYLPGFPPKKEFKLTLKQLVDHTSGIRKPYFSEKNSQGLNIRIKKVCTITICW